MKPVFIKEGLRMFKRKLRVQRKGFKKYSGNVNEICNQIINNCYNQEKKYFMTSTGHFSQFWTRDFGLCVKSLKLLGHRQKIINTLNYALGIFKKHGEITTTITPNGKAFNFPKYAPDSLGFMLHCLVVANDKLLIKKYKSFLQKEANKYYDMVIDKKSGLVKRKYFSSMRDYVIRKSSCYDNVMSGWISINLDKLGLTNPLKKYDYKKIIVELFWTKEGFIDDLSGKNDLSADANTFPFWTGVIQSDRMIKKSIETMRNRKLDKPVPLQYTNKKPKVSGYDFLVKNYQFQTIWPMVALPYMNVVSKVNKGLTKHYLKQYQDLIKKHKTFLEVYDSKKKPFKTTFYICDEGMLWASMYLTLSKKIF